MEMLTTRHFDTIIESLAETAETIPRPDNSDNPENELFRVTNALIRMMRDITIEMRKGHMGIVNELLRLYDEASEHNIDISRQHIFKIAQYLADVPPHQPSQEDITQWT